MEIKDFIVKFAETVEIESVELLNENTNFHDLDEWSSISVMLLIALFDEEYGKELTPAKIDQAKTIQDLFNLAIA